MRRRVPGHRLRQAPLRLLLAPLPPLLPGPGAHHRTTFARQCANLWHVKELIWRRLAEEVAPADDRLHIVDSMPVPVCRFARATFCRRFRGEARYGKDHADRQTFYGFRLHARLTWPGLISEVVLAPANASEQSVLAAPGPRPPPPGVRRPGRPQLLRPPAQGAAGGGRAGPADAARPPGQGRPARVPGQKWALSDTRYRIDTVFGQLTDRFHVKRVWARDLWHLMGRLFRKVLAHTLALILNIGAGATRRSSSTNSCKPEPKLAHGVN